MTEEKEIEVWLRDPPPGSSEALPDFYYRTYQTLRKWRASQRDTDTRLKKLRPLRLPPKPEMRPKFERRLDARLASLARLAQLMPTECVGMALMLGARGEHDPDTRSARRWGAFEIDLSEFKLAPQRKQFFFRMLFAVLDPGLTEPAHRAAGMIRREMTELGIDTSMISDAALTQYVERYRAKPTNDLQALADGDVAHIPVDIVKRLHVRLLQWELRQSAARLTARSHSEPAPKHRDRLRDNGLPGRLE